MVAMSCAPGACQRRLYGLCGLCGLCIKYMHTGARPFDAHQVKEQPDASIAALLDLLVEVAPPPPPLTSDTPLLFSVDHCFGIKGKGTILTGTVVQVKLHIVKYRT